MEDSSSLSLFIIFIEGFKVSSIYEIGWQAAREWMVIASGVLLSLAIAIRSTEEKVNLLAGREGGYMQMVTNIFIIAIAMALYFVIAELIINLFNALYNVLANSPVVEMGNKLDKVMTELRAKDHKFSWSEVGDAVFSGFAMIAYWMSHMVLILVTVAMRIAHALLVSFCLFWGAVALPMSITTGLKMLAPLRNIVLMVLIWPIVESFFMFAISGSFTAMLDSSALNVENFKTWNMGVMVFYLTAFAIINILLAAAMIGAPFVAQGLANGSGNVSGVIGSFAGAGITAGMVSAKSLMPKALVDGAKNSILGSFKSGGSAAAAAMGGEKVRNLANTEIAKGMSPLGGKESYNRDKTSNKNESINKTTTTNTTTSKNFEKSTSSSTPTANSANTNTANKEKNPLEKNALSTTEGDVKNNGLEPSTTTAENSSGNLSDEQRKKKAKSGRAGYFANQAKLNPKTPPK